MKKPYRPPTVRELRDDDLTEEQRAWIHSATSTAPSRWRLGELAGVAFASALLAVVVVLCVVVVQRWP